MDNGVNRTLRTLVKNGVRFCKVHWQLKMILKLKRLNSFHMYSVQETSAKLQVIVH